MISLSARAEMNMKKPTMEPQLILEIDGLPVFGARLVYLMPKLGGAGLYLGKPGLKLGRTIVDESAENLINLGGSTTKITQQLFQDKGMASSVSSMTIELVDKDERLTRAITPGIEVEDLLSRKAIVYLNFGNGAHPEDSVPVLYGVVDTIQSTSALVRLTVAHPEGLKRQDIFTKIQSKLTTRHRYRSKIIQGINWQTQDEVSGAAVTIATTSGGTKGSEVVTIVGNAISIQANTSGVAGTGSTASDIIAAVKKSQAAINLVKPESTTGNENLLQAASAAQALVTDNTLELSTTDGMLKPSTDGTFLTYVRIGDEVLQYTGITGQTLTGVTPAQFETIGRTYEVDEDVETFYRITGGMKDLALKLMLSQGKPIENLKPNSISYFTATSSIPNAIIWRGLDVEKKYGVTAGDLVSCADPDHPENSFTDRLLVSVQKTVSGSYIIVDGATLTPEQVSNAVISFKSKYDVWPDGLGMQIDQVDVARHEEIDQFFPSGLFDYDFYLKDTIRGDDFIASQIYFPSGCYTIPREGRSSVGITIPPLAQATTKTLDESNVVKASGIRVTRSTKQFFYNSVIYKFDEDAVEEKLTKGDVRYSADSVARVENVKNVPLVIEAQGIRDTGSSRQKIQTQMRRYLDRYQFGAEVIETEVLYKIGFDIEIGDTVIFGSNKLQVSDTKFGTRKFRPRVVEVKNKEMDIRTGNIIFTLLDTAFSVDSNYGVVSPSSKVDVGSTSTHIKLKRGITTPTSRLEQYKWLDYVGLKVLVHDKNWTFQEEATFVGFMDAEPNTMILNPGLSMAPGENYIVDIPYYPNSTDQTELALYKAIHAFASPQVKVVSRPAADQIEVGPADIGKFFVDSPLRIHKKDYSVDSGDTSLRVKSIAGNILTLSSPLDFVADNTFLIDLIGFPDKRGPYRIL